MAFVRGPVMRSVTIGLAALSLVGLSACGHARGPQVVDQEHHGIFGFLRGKPAEAGAAEIGVNSYLWRAALDTLKFMPLASADPYGGVIITDWYSDPQIPTERFKATVYILDTRLRADGLNVTVFKQVHNGDAWIDAEPSPQTAEDLENAILTRARQLRLANVNG
jgi:hypothetical protein